MLRQGRTERGSREKYPVHLARQSCVATTEGAFRNATYVPLLRARGRAISAERLIRPGPRRCRQEGTGGPCHRRQAWPDVHSGGSPGSPHGRAEGRCRVLRSVAGDGHWISGRHVRFSEGLGPNCRFAGQVRLEFQPQPARCGTLDPPRQAYDKRGLARESRAIGSRRQGNHLIPWW
jgi:hypothetical protein